jgi:hypothetical protein
VPLPASHFSTVQIAGASLQSYITHAPQFPSQYSALSQYSGICGGFPHNVERNSERHCLRTRNKHSGQTAVTLDLTFITYGFNFSWKILNGKHHEFSIINPYQYFKNASFNDQFSNAYFSLNTVLI